MRASLAPIALSLACFVFRSEAKAQSNLPPDLPPEVQAEVNTSIKTCEADETEANKLPGFEEKMNILPV
jgi:hypothetical protein